MEALLRWVKPRNGLLVPPTEFIPVLEEIGLMPEVGEWVIKEAAESFVMWLDLGLDPRKIAVNISERQFAAKELQKSLAKVLEKTKIPVSALSLEITENLLIDGSHGAITVLEELKELGYSIALDDFGTGYSSLAYLKRFPIDTIKVDRSFVRDMLDDKEDEVIIDAVLAIAKQLKLEVVAEGIETKEQHDALKKKGCELGQGYLFSRPVKRDEMTQLLEEAVISA